MEYKLFDSEDETIYSVYILTAKQVKMKTPPTNILMLTADSYEEAKGMAKGVLLSSTKYTYAFVMKTVEGYKDLDWTIKSADMVYDVWKDDFDEDSNATPGVIH